MTQPTLFPPPPVEVTLSVARTIKPRHFGDARTTFTGRSPHDIVQEWHHCRVTWVEWSGKVVNPTGTPCCAVGVTVRHFGHKTVELSEGTLDLPVRRKLGTPGFTVTVFASDHDADGTTVINETSTLDLQKRIITL